MTSAASQPIVMQRKPARSAEHGSREGISEGLFSKSRSASSESGRAGYVLPLSRFAESVWAAGCEVEFLRSVER